MACLVRLALPLLLAVAGLAFGAHAQEAVTRDKNADPALKEQGLSIQMNTLAERISASTTRLMLLKQCHQEGKMFRTLEDGTEGCMSIISVTTPPPVTPGSLSLVTPGTYSFNVPPYNVLNVDVRGGGGGGGGLATINAGNGGSGGTSAFLNLRGVGGGGGGAFNVGVPPHAGSAGGASGGDTNIAGGGGKGGVGGNNTPGTGGSGGRAVKVWRVNGGGAPGTGSNISVVVGAGGGGGSGYYAGASGSHGAVYISWQ